MKWPSDERMAALSKAIPLANRWDAMTVAERAKVLKRAMPQATWAALRESMASRRSEQLTPVQLDALGDILK